MINVNGQALYECDVEEIRTIRFYVLAQSRNEAEEIASELADDIEPDCIDQFPRSTEAQKEPSGTELIWSGGEEGSWCTWEELQIPPRVQEPFPGQETLPIDP